LPTLQVIVFDFVIGISVLNHSPRFSWTPFQYYHHIYPYVSPSDLFPDLLRSRCYIYALSPPMCASCSTTLTLFDLATLMWLVKNAIYEAFQRVIISIFF